MNEEPPSEFEPSPPMPPHRGRDPYSPPPFWLMFFLGIGLLILSCVLSGVCNSGVPVSLGALTAFVSFFFRGWRGIGAGYLATVGLAILAVIVICGVMGAPRFN